MLAAMARGTVLRGSMISPALAAMAEKPKKVMKARAAMVTMPTASAEKRVAKVSKATVGPTLTLNEVDVVFEGDDQVVEPLVEQFAQKAMRAGG